MRTNPPPIVPDLKGATITKEHFEIIKPPVTLNSFCYKGFSACVDIDNSGLVVVITAPTMEGLKQAWKRLVPEEGELLIEKCKTTVGQYEFMDGIWVQPSLEIPNTEYYVGSMDRSVANYGIFKTLETCLGMQPAQHSCPVFIIADEIPIYRWHKGNKQWLKLQ